jgi:hypothetical protein
VGEKGRVVVVGEGGRVGDLLGLVSVSDVMVVESGIINQGIRSDDRIGKHKSGTGRRY